MLFAVNYVLFFILHFWKSYDELHLGFQVAIYGFYISIIFISYVVAFASITFATRRKNITDEKLKKVVDKFFEINLKPAATTIDVINYTTVLAVLFIISPILAFTFAPTYPLIYFALTLRERSD